MDKFLFHELARISGRISGMKLVENDKWRHNELGKIEAELDAVLGALLINGFADQRLDGSQELVKKQTDVPTPTHE